tara:strand:- start:205 stop:351 length:147 start_codon:yes stop_codon:yes gene_type:complete
MLLLLADLLAIALAALEIIVEQLRNRLLQRKMKNQIHIQESYMYQHHG